MGIINNIKQLLCALRYDRADSDHAQPQKLLGRVGVTTARLGQHGILVLSEKQFLQLTESI